jgi:hypothetical protein
VADVQKNAFMLSSATLMIAPAFTTPVYDLTPALHSVGMVKEVAVVVDSSMIELTNGVAQATVDTKRTGVAASISGSVYEFTAQNMSRANALSGTTTQVRRGTLTAALSSAAVSLSINSDPIPGDTLSAVTGLGDIPAGSQILLQREDGTDYVFPTKSSGVATGVGPFVVPIAGIYAIPAGMSFPIGTKVYVLPAIKVANMDADDLFGVKIVGTLSNYNRPVTFVAPKVKMVKGFNLSFSEGDYGGMPWEMKPLVLTAGEATGRLVDIGTRSCGDLYIGA